MNGSFTRTVALLIVGAILLTLSSCSKQNGAPGTDNSAITGSSDINASGGSAVNLFTIRFNSNYSLNPITGTNPDNMALAPLMYESLFVLNEKLAAEPVLCDNFTTDGINYTFKIKSGISMSDGSTLTASDVKYSLGWAKQAGRFTGRLRIVQDITAVDALTLKITLKSANYMLPELLDIPVIKYGSIEDKYPPGTGPYKFVTSDTPSLSALPGYREPLPVSVIYLKDCSDIELPAAFSSQAIDLFWDDPADWSDINILNDHVVRYYNTTILEFLGFNAKRGILSNPDLRRALGLAIDRKKIVDSIYSNHAIAAPLVISPVCSLYDTAWEKKETDALSEISSIFASLHMDDSNSDGYLEIPNANNSMVTMNLSIIVNGDNHYKVAAAQQITDALRAVGINATLKTLSWSAYMSALQSGSFDMYYGDVFLPADYDLTELLSPGGSIDYGHVGNSSYQTRINAFLGASDETAQKNAAQQMCAYIDEKAPIIPVLYREYAVHTNGKVVLGVNPTQSSIFYGYTGWKITLDSAGQNTSN